MASPQRVEALASRVVPIPPLLDKSRDRTISATATSSTWYARNPPEYLRVGDLMESEIEGIGALRNRIVAADRRADAARG